jgi:myo-inositol 2-dehydrogenase / D-chiro-inositol 1-dehydrogenase
MKSHLSPSALNRRQFMGRILAAAAASPILGLAADAPPPPPAPQRKIKLGVVGCGGRGGWIAKLFQQNGGYEMHAVADYFQPVADAGGDALGVNKTRRFSGLSGYKRLIESGVEAVALEVPPFFFPEQVKAAVAAGLHVYMAKPIAADVPGVLEVQAEAAKATAGKRVFLVDYQLPTDPHNQAVMKLVGEGEIGKVIGLHSHYFAGPFPDPPLQATIEGRLRSLIWCNDNAIGGGYHVNACIHGVDAALWAAGQRPVSCQGLSRIGRAEPHGDSHDLFELLFEYENGLIHSHRGEHMNNYLGFDVVCQIVGNTGYAQTCYGGKAMLKGRENVYNGEVQNLYEAGAVRNIAKFYQCVTTNDFTNDTVARAIDSALATMLGREAGIRRGKMTMAELLKENKRLEVNLKGLKA